MNNLMKTCKHCGKKFPPNKYAAKRQRFCSDKCRSDYGNQKTSKRQESFWKKQKRRCEICGKLYTPKRKHQRYCGSRLCRDTSYYRNTRRKAQGNKPLEALSSVRRVCEHCHKRYTPKQWDQKFCKPICERRHNGMMVDRHRRILEKNLPGIFTKHQWKMLKLLCDERCLCCGKQKRLERDHIIPISWKGSSDWIDNVQPLCRSCNAKKGNKSRKDYRPKYIKEAMKEVTRWYRGYIRRHSK